MVPLALVSGCSIQAEGGQSRDDERLESALSIFDEYEADLGPLASCNRGGDVDSCVDAATDAAAAATEAAASLEAMSSQAEDECVSGLLANFAESMRGVASRFSDRVTALRTDDNELFIASNEALGELATDLPVLRDQLEAGC